MGPFNFATIHISWSGNSGSCWAMNTTVGVSGRSGSGRSTVQETFGLASSSSFFCSTFFVWGGRNAFKNMCGRLGECSTAVLHQRRAGQEDRPVVRTFSVSSPPSPARFRRVGPPQLPVEKYELPVIHGSFMVLLLRIFLSPNYSTRLLYCFSEGTVC